MSRFIELDPEVLTKEIKEKGVPRLLSWTGGVSFICTIKVAENV